MLELTAEHAGEQNIYHIKLRDSRSISPLRIPSSNEELKRAISAIPASLLAPYFVRDMVVAPRSFAHTIASMTSGVSPEYEMTKATSCSVKVEAEVICM